MHFKNTGGVFAFILALPLLPVSICHLQEGNLREWRTLFNVSSVWNMQTLEYVRHLSHGQGNQMSSVLSVCERHNIVVFVYSSLIVYGVQTDFIM